MDPVVLDHGAAVIKAGYANPESHPALLLPSLFCATSAPKSEPLGHTDLPTPKDADLLKALDGGRIVNWDVMEDVWEYIFYEFLGWEEGNEGPVFIVDPVLTPRADREYLAQVMFERFNVSGLFALESPICCVYSMGRLSGCCVDVGHSKTDFAAVSDGALVPGSVYRWDAGGWDLEVLLGRLLARSNPEHATAILADGGALAAEQGSLRLMKEELCSVAGDGELFRAAVKAAPPRTYHLPDGQAIRVSGEGLVVGEALFRPQAVGQPGSGIVDLLVQAVAECASSFGCGGQESDRLRTLLDSVALVGGTPSMPGFAERFLRELRESAPPSLHPSVMKAPDYMPEDTARYAAWIGGSIVSKIVFSQNQQVTRGDYDEKGPAVIHKKLG